MSKRKRASKRSVKAEPKPAPENVRDAAQDSGDQDTGRALQHLGVVLAVLLAACGFTYIASDFETFRPYRHDGPLPLATLFSSAEELPAFAGAGNEGDLPEPEPSAEVEPDPIAEVIEQVGTDPDRPPSLRPFARHDEVRTPIIDAGGQGLRPFFARLAETARARLESAQDGGTNQEMLTRVGHWGDSSIATDLITSTMRERMQQRFGDGGHGFVLLAKGYLPYRHRGLQHSASDGWILREVVRNHIRSGLYGYGGVQFRGRPRQWARFATAERGRVGHEVSRFLLYYQRHNRGGDIRYTIDDGERQVIETRREGEGYVDDVETIRVPDGAHELEVRFGGNGQPRIYGVAMERDVPGVVYDSLGLVGARAARLLNYDRGHIAGQIRMRGTNLIVLAFGGNEASDNISRARYTESYQEVIARMRAGRDDIGCLVMAPLDQAERNSRGEIVTMESIPDIVASQEVAAREAGCAFFNTWEAVGGEGTMRRWLRHRPRLALADLRHATPAGYERVAELFFNALMQQFDRYLEEVEAMAPSEEELQAPGEQGSEEAPDTVEPSDIRTSP